MGDVDVVCVNFRAEPELLALTRALGGSADTQSWSLFVVDCSGTLAGVRRELELAAGPMAVAVVDPGANVGFGPAANLGALAGRAPVVLFVNPDAAPIPAGLATVARLGLRAGATAWSGVVRNPDGTVQRNAGPPPSLPQLSKEYLLGRDTRLPLTDQPREVGVLTGAVLFVRRARFEAIGGFDEAFPLYMEDVDLSMRLGAPRLQFPVEVGSHSGGSSAAHAPVPTWLLLHASRVAFFQRQGRWPGRSARVVVLAGCALRRLARGQAVPGGQLKELARLTAPGTVLARLLPPGRSAS